MKARHQAPFDQIIAAKMIGMSRVAALAARCGFLYTFSENPYWLVSVQLLDGIGAGIYGAIVPIIVADVRPGTGNIKGAG
jgi:hypothetical protein